MARLAAQLLDGFIAIIAVLPGAVVMGVGGAFEDEAIEAETLEPLALFGFLLLFLGAMSITIYQWVLLSRDGQTLGKKALGIKIVRHYDGANPGFGRAVALRIWVNNLISGIPCCGALYALIDVLLIFGVERRCIHDYIAGTIVVDVL
jgi:uncharacterized RDD family membrane protein YckC